MCPVAPPYEDFLPYIELASEIWGMRRHKPVKKAEKQSLQVGNIVGEKMTDMGKKMTEMFRKMFQGQLAQKDMAQHEDGQVQQLQMFNTDGKQLQFQMNGATPDQAKQMMSAVQRMFRGTAKPADSASD